MLLSYSRFISHLDANDVADGNKSGRKMHNLVLVPMVFGSVSVSVRRISSAFMRDETKSLIRTGSTHPR